ncbi:MAG TPA: ABC transporter substrate-binding protein [Gaiellaceae bacterium]|jgi:branched-chain amino acid transport system substrate-binding protein|nr:ABC transporter substrate-binding protein [Gaiellaceae bacterium]
MSDEHGSGKVTRRELLKRAGVGAAGLAVSGTFAEPIWARAKTWDASNTIKIGFVSPLTGPAAGFGEGDPYIIGLARHAWRHGTKIGGRHYKVEVVNRDSQSDPAKAAQVANELIHATGVDLMLTTSTPEVVNPVADACEAAGVPCVGTVDPWESFYFGRGAKPGGPNPFRYSFLFSFGTAQFAEAYEHLWPQVKTNKHVGVMYPNDTDGNAFRSSLIPLLEHAGYKVFDPGGYQDGQTDYTSLISFWKKHNCQIFHCAPIPPDFTTCWKQAAQQGYTKMCRIAQLAKTGLFPSQIAASGKLGPLLASGAYWTPTFPYKSSLTGISSEHIGHGYTKKTGRQWNQQLGASLSLFDVAEAVLRKAGDPKDKNKVAAAFKHLNVMTPSGRLHWGTGGKHNPVPPVVTTPIIGGQWVHTKKGSRFPLDFVLCEHSGDHHVPVKAKLKRYPG